MIKIKLNESSNIKEVWYDANKKLLVIEFMNGIKYMYFDIEPTIILEWQKAESVGKFFAQHIKFAKYKRLEANDESYKLQDK